MKNDVLIPAIAWILLTVICLVLIVTGLHRALKRAGWEKRKSRKMTGYTIAVITGWVVLLLALSRSGFFSDFGLLPPRPALAILIPLPVILFIAFSKQGTRLLQAIPAPWLIWMQSFRIAVECMLLMAFLQGRLPEQMTFEGMNFDIVSGLLALPAGYLLVKAKTYAKSLAILYNIIGLLLLLNILVIAVLSMPTPIRYFMNEPANTLVAEFPYILLPGVLVPVAYGLHILSLRQLLTADTKSLYTLEQPA